LVIVNPGHFHAALTLRQRHPLLRDDVYVYAEDGPEVESFLDITRSFNARENDPTRWTLHTYRGDDYFERLLTERPGDIAVLAGKSLGKTALLHRLHAAGFHVLCDKPMLIAGAELDLLEGAVTAPPLAMEIMTGRHDPVSRLLKALVGRGDLFGAFRAGADPAIDMTSTHHLYKIVNGAPLIRPAWFFDTAVQGEGITDVTTHYVDLAQWLTADAPPDGEDLELSAARQWPTEIPRTLFATITGLADFPASLGQYVADDTLSLLCNAAVTFRARGIPARIESHWAPAVPDGGGDTHRVAVHGTRATVTSERSAETGFQSTVTVQPVDGNLDDAMAGAVEAAQDDFPGLSFARVADAYRVTIPERLHTTHEEHFSAVLDDFLGHVERGHWPDTLAREALAKYLLTAAAALSHRDG
jgi:predicted dehydrogenase